MLVGPQSKAIDRTSVAPHNLSGLEERTSGRRNGHAWQEDGDPAPGDTAYLDEITMMLRDLLRQVIKVREPRVLAMIDDPAKASSIPAPT